MRKLVLSLAALSAIAIALPASAETLVVKEGMHRHHDRARVGVVVRHDRGWHRGWHHRDHGAKVIVR